MSRFTKIEARQGVTGHKLRYVLGVSFVLAIMSLGTVAILVG